MRPLSDDDLNKVERALTEAHRLRPQASLEAGWAQQVMRRIRQESDGHAQPTLAAGMDRLVWRAAAVAAMFAVIFAGSVLVYTGKDPVEVTVLLSDGFDVEAPLIE